jgi:flagellar biosynthesis/type III secretory pathway protein FliH
MPEAFRSLVSMVSAPREPTHDESLPPVLDTGASHQAAEAADEGAQLMRDIRVFRARIAEGVEAALDVLLADIAADVLARELCLAPADVQKVVDCALARYQSEEPVRVRVHCDEINSVGCTIPVIADPDLRTGDAVIELRSGTVQATLGIRLADVLAAARACS